MNWLNDACQPRQNPVNDMLLFMQRSMFSAVSGSRRARPIARVAAKHGYI
jgi:hypothetical protein